MCPIWRWSNAYQSNRRSTSKLPGGIIQGYGQTEGTTMTFLSQEDHVNAIKGINPES